MKLYILRHGEAVDQGDPAFRNDADRPLTPKGAQRTKSLAHALRGLGISLDIIFSSPFTRARQTAEIMEHGLRLHNRLEITDCLAPPGKAEKLVAQLSGIRPAPESVLIVGHEPFLSELISALCVGGTQLLVKLKKGGLCRLDVATLRHGQCADLEWLLPSRLFGAKSRL